MAKPPKFPRRRCHQCQELYDHADNPDSRATCRACYAAGFGKEKAERRERAKQFEWQTGGPIEAAWRAAVDVMKSGEWVSQSVVYSVMGKFIEPGTRRNQMSLAKKHGAVDKEGNGRAAKVRLLGDWWHEIADPDKQLARVVQLLSERVDAMEAKVSASGDNGQIQRLEAIVNRWMRTANDLGNRVSALEKSERELRAEISGLKRAQAPTAERNLIGRDLLEGLN